MPGHVPIAFALTSNRESAPAAPRLSPSNPDRTRTQNRAVGFQQPQADDDFNEHELELMSSTEMTRQIHLLTTELHQRICTGEGRVAGPIRI